MIVSLEFQVDEYDLSEKAEENEYWEKSYNFWLKVKKLHVENLTEGQVNWLRKIERGLRPRVW